MGWIVFALGMLLIRWVIIKYVELSDRYDEYRNTHMK